MSFFVVNKKFDGNGETFQYGDVVDTSDWKYTQQLVSLRYLIPADANVVMESRVPRENAEVVVEPKKTTRKTSTPVTETSNEAPKRTLERKSVESLSTDELIDA